MHLTNVPPYLIYPIISVSFLRAVFTVLSTFAAAHNSNGFAFLPVLSLCSVFVINRDVAVESQRPDENQRKI